ncbi:hypothetical protein Moror_3112 [Moniliophthora roreri MCA 2997]|uniref:Uncharacterized protein n=1 Tax=Moniliophthora roreri (strain MCA 2997) TaxID=1381753 RepID=V2YAC2_MONRO|nr:hypothetical protein Moror_3112 [Moniliophthora roreri MCA 2997]
MSIPLSEDNIYTLVQVFNSLNILGLILLTFTIIPAIWSRTVHRMDAWYSLTISSMLYCISFLILIGHQFGKEPPFEICLFQAALIYAGPVFIKISITSFVISLYLNISNIPTTSFHQKMLIAAPITMFLLICIEVTMVGLLDRSHIERDPTHMFCHCHDTNIPFGVDVFIEVLTAGIDINFLIMIGQTLYKRWKTNQATVSPVGRISNPAFSMALYLRVLLFTLYLALALLIVAIGVLKPTGPSVAWNISLPTVPVASGLIFGSQKDILQAWAGYARGLKYSIWNLIQKVLNAFRYPSRVDSIDGLKAASSQLELDQACRTHL